MAQVITLTAWKIIGPSGNKGVKPDVLTSPITIGVNVANQNWDVREQFPRDPDNASIYSIVTKIAGSGNIPVQYYVQETVAQVIAAANA